MFAVDDERIFQQKFKEKHSLFLNESFSVQLFGYISGKNSTQTKIAMTTPVHMEKGNSENAMAFVLPKKFNTKNTPQPSDNSLQVYQDQGGYFAAIRYAGYTNSEKEKERTALLMNVLEDEKINSDGHPKVLVYNSPYKIINRRNEILIPILFQPPNND